jgi:predicted Zn-dependent protease
MTNRKLWPVALAVPFAIVAIVWAFAGVYLFQPAPAFDRVREANGSHQTNGSPQANVNLQATGGRKPKAGPSLDKSKPKQLAFCIERRQAYSTPQPGYFRDDSFAAPPVNYRQTRPWQSVPSTASSADYLSAVNTEGNFRWSPDRLPIDVYIDDGRGVAGFQPQYRQMLKDAFDAWCDTSGGLMTWREVSNPQQADVTASWTSNPTIRPGSVEAGQTKTLVQQNKYTGDGKIMTAQISILTQLMGRSFNNDAMQKTCLHEVGHALGLQGHSDVPSDIMYPTVNEQQVAHLKQRDVNTLARLYSGSATDAIARTPQSRMMRRGFDEGADDSNVPPWMNRSVGQAPRNYPVGPRYYQLGGMNRQAAIRELMRRAAAQNGWYN